MLVGLGAVAVPTLGVTIAGAGLLAALGGAIGGWSAALAGSAVPNEVRRRFEAEIARGRILLVLDSDKELLRQAETALVAFGAEPLPFDKLSIVCWAAPLDPVADVAAPRACVRGRHSG